MPKSEIKIESENSFETLIRSSTIEEMKEIISLYNDNLTNADLKAEPLKGFSGLKKNDLVEFIIKSIPKKVQSQIYKQRALEFGKQLINNALGLIAGEDKLESIQSTVILSGGKGFRLNFKGQNWTHESSVEIEENKIKRSCNCKVGAINGVCDHQMAIFLMLLLKNRIKISDLPFPVEIDWFGSIQTRLNQIASQGLFKEEPNIVLEEDYNIYINDNFVTLEWGGDFSGKTTKDLTGQDIHEWMANKVAEIIVRKIKVTTKEGKPIKILVDNYGIIKDIMQRPQIVAKIIKKFSALEDPLLPKDEKSLEEYLKSSLKKNILDLEAHPPFEAYEGSEPYIFASYTHKDKVEVYKILKELHAEGFKIWYDEGIPLSTEWANIIGQKLIGCSVFLSFISSNVNDSNNTQDEIHLAINENKKYVAVYLEKCDLVPGLKMRMRRIQGILKYEMEIERFYKNLIEELHVLMKSK